MATSTIKAINETVSVTGNGVKTIAQLLNELYALVDNSKITNNATVNLGGGAVYHLISKSNSYLEFTYSQAAASAVNVGDVQMGSNSKYYSGAASSSGYTRTNNSSIVIDNGKVIKLVY